MKVTVKASAGWDHVGSPFFSRRSSRYHQLVDEAVLAPLRTRRQDWPALLRNDRGSKAQLDLKALVGRQAAESGVQVLVRFFLVY